MIFQPIVSWLRLVSVATFGNLNPQSLCGSVSFKIFGWHACIADAIHGPARKLEKVQYALCSTRQRCAKDLLTISFVVRQFRIYRTSAGQCRLIATTSQLLVFPHRKRRPRRPKSGNLREIGHCLLHPLRTLSISPSNATS